MKLPVSLQNDLVGFLESIPIIDDMNGREAFITILDSDLQKQIGVEQPPAKFVRHLVKKLLNYNIWIDEHSALIAVLNATKGYTGADKQKQCDDITSKLLAETERQKTGEQQKRLKLRKKVPGNSSEKKRLEFQSFKYFWGIIIVLIIVFLFHVRIFDSYVVPFNIFLTSYIIRIGDSFLNKGFSDRIAMITINDEHFDKSWRKTHALLVDKLSQVGAKVIVFDMFFEEPNEFDDKFVEAINKAKNEYNTAVIVGIQDFQGNQPKLLDKLRQANVDFGILCVGKELNEVRKIPLVIIKNDIPIYSLSLKAVELYLGKKIIDVDFKNNHLTLGKKEDVLGGQKIKFSNQIEVQHFQKHCPSIQQGDNVAEMFIDLSPCGSLIHPLRRYDYNEVIKQVNPEELNRFHDKIVLVGIQSRYDMFEVYRGLKRETCYGIEIHADAINTLLSNVYIHSSEYWDWSFIGLFGGIGLLMAYMFPQLLHFKKKTLLIWGGFILGGLIVAIIFYCWKRILLNVAYYWMSSFLLFHCPVFIASKLKR